MNDLPSLTVVIPALNEEKNLWRCLGSLADQDYPKDRFEVIVADAGSTDRSADVISSFSDKLDIRTVDNSERRETEWGKGLAIAAAQGELVQLMDADMWATSSSMLRRLVAPLVADDNLAGSVAPYMFLPELSPWTRFLTCDVFQRDPLCQALTPDITRFVVEPKDGYVVCEFPTVRVPPMGGTTMYRRPQIDLSRWGGYFNEVDQPAYLVKRGWNRFAYVSEVGWGHDHCRGLSDLVRKRVRNLGGPSNSYLRSEVKRDFIWVDTSNKKEVIRLLLWVLGTNLIVPRFFEGLAQALKLRKWEPLLRPIAAIAVTDALAMSLLRAPQGRALARSAISKTD